MNLSKLGLDAWIADLNELDLTSLDETKSRADTQVYTEWLKSQQRKVAPGFNFDIMTPTKQE